jgi:hypothetical protein
MATVRVRIAILTVRITLSVCVRSIVWHILPTEAEAISDVIVEDVVDKITQEALLDNDGKTISTAFKKLQLEQNTSSYVMNVCTLPDSASGNSACEVMQTMIQSNTRDKNWFDDDPSPFETP